MSVTNLDTVAATIIGALSGFEEASRRLHPFHIPDLRNKLLAHARPLENTRATLLNLAGETGYDSTGPSLLRACDLLRDALGTFGAGNDLQASFTSVMRAVRKSCQAQEAVFPLCRALPSVNRYFLEPGMAPELWLHEPQTDTGLFHVSPQGDLYDHGAYSLYIPERRTAGLEQPLVVALHGGQGHGRDFIWTWLREARSRGFALLAPSSLGPTWSILDVAIDDRPLKALLDDVCSRFGINRENILITGMSDGGTFALASGISLTSPYAAIAPVSCVLPPVDMRCAAGRRIFWIHGAQDWMFPVNRAVQACRDLVHAGADVKLSVLPDLAHAYPREENDAIIRWFGKSSFTADEY